MQIDFTKFFSLQRQIFGICSNPCCGEFFRLSDCKIFLKRRPMPDWMDSIDSEKRRLDRMLEKLEEKEEEIREEFREKGRQRAYFAAKKIDPVFTPRRLNPDDAKVIFHPVDYVVFNGLRTEKTMKNIILFDRFAKQSDHKRIQRSIERVVDREEYDWKTIRVHQSGQITLE